MKSSFLNSILEYRYQTNAYIALLLESGYFEPGISKALSKNILKNVIKEDMNYWFPNVIVNTVFLDITTAQKNKNTDNYIISIKIQFTVNNQTDVLGLTVTSNL